jgi:hypothetical protein
MCNILYTLPYEPDPISTKKILIILFYLNNFKDIENMMINENQYLLHTANQAKTHPIRRIQTWFFFMRKNKYF